MPTTVDEYINRSKDMISHGDWNVSIEPTSAVLWGAADSHMAGGAFTYAPDFGYLVCLCRYMLLESEFETEGLPLWKFTADELAQRRAAAEAGLDELLEEFVREGYQVDMGERLLRIGQENFFEYEFLAVYVLPSDLELLLDDVGNPLADQEADDEELASATAPPFDLNNPDHRRALAELLDVSG